VERNNNKGGVRTSFLAATGTEKPPKETAGAGSAAAAVEGCVAMKEEKVWDRVEVPSVLPKLNPPKSVFGAAASSFPGMAKPPKSTLPMLADSAAGAEEAPMAKKEVDGADEAEVEGIPKDARDANGAGSFFSSMAVAAASPSSLPFSVKPTGLGDSCSFLFRLVSVCSSSSSSSSFALPFTTVVAL
jgi:hypothetical protein